MAKQAKPAARAAPMEAFARRCARLGSRARPICRPATWPTGWFAPQQTFVSRKEPRVRHAWAASTVARVRIAEWIHSAASHCSTPATPVSTAFNVRPSIAPARARRRLAPTPSSAWVTSHRHRPREPSSKRSRRRAVMRAPHSPRGAPTQMRVMPPSSTISSPVMYDESLDARNSVALATSSAEPKRPSGIRAMSPWVMPSSVSAEKPSLP